MDEVDVGDGDKGGVMTIDLDHPSTTTKPKKRVVTRVYFFVQGGGGGRVGQEWGW